VVVAERQKEIGQMQRTGIQYLTHTWNPLAMRCTPVSEACQNCWHIKMAKRHAANPMHSEDVRAAYAGNGIMLKEDELAAPLRLRKPARIGVQFMGDLFLEGVGYHWQEKVWDVMEECPQHTFVVLTKRPSLMLDALDELVVSHGVLPNVWLGVTAENQQRALLLQCPAAVRWVSAEPLLGPVKIRDALEGVLFKIDAPEYPEYYGTGNIVRWARSPSIDWVVCGAESGAGARYMDPRWAELLLWDCVFSGKPFYMKQMSNRAPIPEDLMVREYPA